MGGKKIVYLIRHGEAFHNLVGPDSMWKQRRDVELVDPGLTERGISEAQDAAKALSAQLAKHGDESIGAVLSSPLRRALQTAEAAVMPSLAAANPPRLIFAALGEVLCDDIWNEPREASKVAEEWPQWQIACSQDDPSAYQEDPELRQSRPWPMIDTCESMVLRGEEMWRRLWELEASVIAVFSHKCFLKFFAHRLAAAGQEVDTEAWRNGEIRRIELQEPSGQMSWEEVGTGFLPESFGPWDGYGSRAKVVGSSGGPRDERWSEKDWRFH